MTRLWTFPGGIHPPERKALSNARALRVAALPDRLILPLQQHVGQPASVRVTVGQTVLKGDRLADLDGGRGVPVHAPTSGTVDAIAQHPVPHPSGLDDLCLILRPDGDDRWRHREPWPDYQRRGPEAVLARIRDAGIAGLGGAGFPTHEKLTGGRQRPIDTLIVNGAECEPYITADDRTMRERAADVVAGIAVLQWLLSPARTVVGIEDNKPEAIAAMADAARFAGIEVVAVPTLYPSGGERQLIRILTGREVPSGGLPAEVGVVCQNVGTALAVGQAVLQDHPLISRVITLTGTALAEPGNVEALIGTPVADLMAGAGLRADNLERLVMGGPMMGFALATDAVPVTKTSNCVIAVAPGEFGQPAIEQPCIRCGECASACPMTLLPQQLFWHAKSGEYDKAEHLNLFDCIECGACAYVCPSAIPLVQHYRHAKGELRQRRDDQKRADQARERFEARQARLERERLEKEKRRQERARAAAEAQARKANGAAAPQPDDRAAKAALVQQALARKRARADKAVNAQKTASASPGDQSPTQD
ncbi:electron transport complex subunit RsxC [Marinobacter sp. C2H3]|uniref:electron transport complex subunit RsxC n=1 Tax=Marinobacter sp. C2H3 TaxID=3119003 RepID=UPI00300F5DB4